MKNFEKMPGNTEPSPEDRDCIEFFINEYRKRERKEISPREFVDIMVEQGKLTPEEASKIIVELDQKKIKFKPYE